MITRSLSQSMRTMLCCFRGHHREHYVINSDLLGVQESLIVNSSKDSRIYIWDRANGALLDILDELESGCVNSISVNPAGPNMFVSTGDDKTTRVWIVQQS
ncbi:hypothetical protein BO71DRAFT_148833 [Aspergillus ellipticus CBS 707.79]|uniref:Uncharacterized protein n=1 Tax=Aspergillus ellipticus CBS 707.79 TaxID=1448320 RepID=A0A319E002_9EURO|nr:hypothetical protein BO71DRAFT_148833 [Aspergillus ellipticus CBS 707.79]